MPKSGRYSSLSVRLHALYVKFVNNLFASKGIEFLSQTLIF